MIFHRGRAVVTATLSDELFELVFNQVSGQSRDICEALAEPV